MTFSSFCVDATAKNTGQGRRRNIVGMPVCRSIANKVELINRQYYKSHLILHWIEHDRIGGF